MRRTAFTCAGLLCLVSPIGAAATTGETTAAVSQEQHFEAYPAGDARTGVPASLRLTSPLAESYRGLLTPALRRPANFAGRYRLETWAAFNGCFRGAAIDLKTGAVTFLPLDMCGRGRPFAARAVAFRRDSRLVSVVDPIAGKPPVTRYFALNGAAFTEITKRLAQQGDAADRALALSPAASPAPKSIAPTPKSQPEPGPAQVAIAAPEAEPASDAMEPPKGVDPVYPGAKASAPPLPPDESMEREAGSPAAQQDAADVEATAPPKGADPVYPNKPAKAAAPPVDPAPDRTGSLEASNRKVAALALGDQSKRPPAEAAASAQSLAFSACSSTWGYFIDASNKANVSVVLEGLNKGPTLVLHLKDGATTSELVGVRDRGPWNLDLTVPPFGQEAVSRIISGGRLIFVSLSFLQSGTSNRLVLKTFGFNDTGKPCPPASKSTVESQGPP